MQKFAYLSRVSARRTIRAHQQKSGLAQGETGVCSSARSSYRDVVIRVRRSRGRFVLWTAGAPRGFARFAERGWRATAAEITRVRGAVGRRGRDRGVRGFVVAIGLCVVIATVSALDSRHGGQHWVDACCGERDGDPLRLWVWRLPGSMIAPPPGLPVWGSLLQVLVVVGIAEASVGRTWTVAVGLAGHVLSGVTARLLIDVGPGVLGGLPPVDRFVLDTGPSAATVALTAYLVVVLRCPILGTLAATGVVLGMLAHSDLAGREHVVAWIVGMACGAGHLLLLRRRAAHASMRDMRGLRTSIARHS